VAYSGYSRSLVYHDSKKAIVGYIFANQVVAALFEKNENTKIKDIAHPIHTIKESTSLEEALASMIKTKENIYLISHDGSSKDVIGIVTLKDILEKLII
jgi:CBS domain containing-hemolysin-like protein